MIIVILVRRLFCQHYLKSLKMKKLIIINAIIWATVILVSAILFKDSDNWDIFFILIISLSTITNGAFCGINSVTDMFIASLSKLANG